VNVAVAERDLSSRPLSEPELRALVGERDVTPFLNSRNELYRERGMKTSPPSRDEAIRLMSEHPNLIRRPLLVTEDEIVYGFDEAAYRRLLAGAEAGEK
jgi:arsenate reductase (glutaredoxin)